VAVGSQVGPQVGPSGTQLAGPGDPRASAQLAGGGPSKTPLLIAIVAVVAIVAVTVMVLATRGGGDDSKAAAPPPAAIDAGAKPAVAVDAAPVVTPPDATPAVIVDAGVAAPDAKKKDRHDKPDKKIDAGPKGPKVWTGTEAWRNCPEPVPRDYDCDTIPDDR
jgi:hypothetical protein